MSAPSKREATIRDAQEALRQATGEEPVSRPSVPVGVEDKDKKALAERRGKGPGVIWEVPSTAPNAGRKDMSPYPHITGANPLAPSGSVGASHHLTTIQSAHELGFRHIERDASNTSTEAPSNQWLIAERVHHVVQPGGTLGPAQHDQHLAIRIEPNAQGTHDVRSATVTAATHSQQGEVVIRTDSQHQPLSPRTVKRTFQNM